MDEIIIIGSGGHSNSCIDVINEENKYKIAGYVVESNYIEKENLKFPIIGTDDDLPYIRKSFKYAIITIGQIKNSSARVNLYKILNNLDFVLPVIISPNAYISKSASIGPGTIIMHDAMINANVNIGYNCIINSKSLIEHDARIGNNTHISTGAIINGNVVVGNRCFIGSGATLKNGIDVIDKSIIAQGAIVKSKPKNL